MKQTLFLQNSKRLDNTAIENLARPLVSIIQDFYNNPENEKKYQEWRVKHGNH